ncbi:Protein MMS22-like [Chamberlinius hualienensis]
MARQFWARIERFSKSLTSYHAQEENWQNIRHDILKFLWSLKCVTQSLNYDERLYSFPLIMENLAEFYQGAGHLNELSWEQSSSYYYSHYSKENSLYHFLHLNLDLRWMMIMFLSDVEERGVTCDSFRSLDKFLQDIVWDLVGISFIRFSNITLQDYEKTNPFSCSCIQRSWVKVINFIDLRHIERQTDYFWLTLHGVFSEIRCQETGFFNKLLSKVCVFNELGFCWWLLFHLASLYQNDIVKSKRNAGTFINFSNHYELNSLLKMTLSSKNGGYSELQLRCYLRCCVKILNMWEPSIEAPLLTWEFYSKRFSDNFKQPDDVMLQHFHGKSGLYLKRMIEEIYGQINDNLSHLNSFQLFLKILANFLNTAHSKHFEWKEIQQKAASTFTERLLQTSNIQGLYNVCCLILVLGSTGNLNDTVKMFMDSATVPDSYTLDGGKISIIWRTYFALIFYCLEQRIDILQLERKILENMKCLERDLFKIKGRLHPGHWSNDLKMTYFESLKDLFEDDRYIRNSQTSLLDFGLTEVISHSSESVVSASLTCINILISKLIRISDEHFTSSIAAVGGLPQYNAILTSVFNAVYLWIKKLVCVDFVEEYELSCTTLSSVAIGITELRYKFSGKHMCKENVKMFVSYFCFNQQISQDFVCKYVVKLISVPSLLLQAEKDINDFQTQIMQLWFRLSFKMPTTSLHYVQFCRSLKNLPEIVKLFDQVQIPLIEFSSDRVVISELLKVFNAYYMKNLNVMQIRCKVAAYMADLIKTVRDTLTGNKFEETMRIYNIVGEIFQQISPLIYIRSKPDCLLHEFVNQLLLPPTVYSPNSKITSSVLAALKENLCLFIEGISHLDFVCDSYVGRTLKDIFIQYLYRFPVSSCIPDMALHPLFISFINVRQKNKRSLEFLTRIMEALRDHYIIRRNTHPQLEMCLLFIKEALIRCSAKDRCLLCPILLTALLKLMMVSNVRDIATDVVQLLADSLPADEDNLIEELFGCLKQIISEHFRSYQTLSDYIFQLLISVSIKYPSTVRRLNVLIGEIISERERNICGSDEALRYASNFISSG